MQSRMWNSPQYGVEAQGSSSYGVASPAHAFLEVSSFPGRPLRDLARPQHCFPEGIARCSVHRELLSSTNSGLPGAAAEPPQRQCSHPSFIHEARLPKPVSTGS
eukprot:RCo050133